MLKKRCSRCRLEKPLDEFHRNSGERDGHRSDCKVCHMRYKRRRTVAHLVRQQAARELEPEFEITVDESFAGAQEPPGPHTPVARSSNLRPAMAAPVCSYLDRSPESGRFSGGGGGVSLERILFVPDTHAPYHHEPAWQLMLRAMRVFKPDKICILGDFSDFYSVSSHSKNPERVLDLEYEVGIVKEKLSELDALGARWKIYVAGNHEDRLERYLMDKAPALFRSVKIPEVLELAERGWQYVPYRSHVKIGKLHITHDTGNAGQNANRKAMDAFQGSAVIGHTHRMEYSVTGCADGPPAVGAMFGWLGDFDRVDYLHQIQAKRAWCHGFGIGFQEPSGVVHLQPIPIVNGRCCVLGQLIS